MKARYEYQPEGDIVDVKEDDSSKDVKDGLKGKVEVISSNRNEREIKVNTLAVDPYLKFIHKYLQAMMVDQSGCDGLGMNNLHFDKFRLVKSYKKNKKTVVPIDQNLKYF